MQDPWGWGVTVTGHASSRLRVTLVAVDAGQAAVLFPDWHSAWPEGRRE